MRFLQVGLGSMGKRRVRCIHALRAGETVAFDLRADRRAEAESLYGIRTVASFEEGMAGDPDAIIISTPPDQHVEYCLAAIVAGKPFFAEETVMLDPEAVTPVLEALARRPVVAAPSCTMRFHPAVTQIPRHAAERRDRPAAGLHRGEPQLSAGLASLGAGAGLLRRQPGQRRGPRDGDLRPGLDRVALRGPDGRGRRDQQGLANPGRTSTTYSTCWDASAAGCRGRLPPASPSACRGGPRGRL